MVEAITSPFLWFAASFAGIFFCAWRMDKAAVRLGIEVSTKPDPPPKSAVLIRNALVAGALVIGVLYLLNQTSFGVSLTVLLAGSLYYWREAYRGRVLPLVAAGMSRSDARQFTFMQWVWLGPLTIAFALLAWGRYSAP